MDTRPPGGGACGGGLKEGREGGREGWEGRGVSTTRRIIIIIMYEPFPPSFPPSLPIALLPFLPAFIPRNESPIQGPKTRRGMMRSGREVRYCLLGRGRGGGREGGRGCKYTK